MNEEAHNRPYRKKTVNYRKENVENRKLEKEYKGGKIIEVKTIEVTQSPCSIGDRRHHVYIKVQIKNKDKNVSFSEKQRQKILTDFWKIILEQTIVNVLSQVEASPSKEQSTGGRSWKNHTYKSRLQVNKKQVPVC